MQIVIILSTYAKIYVSIYLINAIYDVLTK